MDKIEEIKEKYHGAVIVRYSFSTSGEHSSYNRVCNINEFLDELQPFLKTPKEELFIELGKILFNNLELLDQDIIGQSGYCDNLEPKFNELLAVVDKIRELENG